MFDFTIAFSNERKSKLVRLEINNFPNGIKPQTKQWDYDYVKVCAYYNDNLYHNWNYENDTFIVLSLGEVLIRSDASEVFKQNNILESILNLFSVSSDLLTRSVKGNYVLLFVNKCTKFLTIITSKSCQYDVHYVKYEGVYYISTSIKVLKEIDLKLAKINEVSFIETFLFDYPLGKKTLYKNIEWLEQGFIYLFSGGGLSSKCYHKWETCIQNYKPKLDWKSTYREVPNIFNKALQSQIDNKNIIISALTSGFDSRTILSFLKNKYSGKVLYYSWGKEDSVDVIYPKIIADKLKLNYYHADFGEDFMNDYLQSAKDSISFTNGRSTVRRANHFFYYKKLSEFSRYNITGLYGSEILRPISSIGHMYNGNFLKILKDPSDNTILEVINNLENNIFVSNVFVKSFKEETLENIKTYIRKIKCDFPDYLALLNFTLSSALMKYFGHEIHGTRSYVFTYSPFIDDEFIEFLFLTPVLELDKKAMDLNFKKHLWNTRRGQLFYIPIIKQNYPKLLKLKTGRFYSPSQLSSPFFPLTVIHALIKKQKYQKTASLGSENWILEFIEEFKKSSIDDNKYSKIITIPVYSKNKFLDFAKYISLKYYLLH